MPESKFVLRLEEEEKNKIKKVANENNRSINQEIRYAIKKHIKTFEEATGRKL